jgi:signal transduction histidine kinase
VAFAFRTKLLASHVGLVLIVVVFSFIQLNRSLAADLERQIDLRLEQQARGAAEWVGDGGHRHPDRLAGRIASVVNADVSIFDQEGRLLGDSPTPIVSPVVQVSPEIVEARHGNVGHATRTREATHDEMHYVAVPTEEGFIIRLGAPLSEVHETVVGMQRRLFGAAVLAILVAIALGIFAARFASRPLSAMTDGATRIAAGDLETRIAAESPDEFGLLARALNVMAEQLKERMTMRRDYLANVSHELRTPVAAIQGYAETLLEQSATPEMQRQFIDTIHRQAQRIGALVDELFVLADLEARPIDRLELEPVNVGHVARLVAETIRGRAAPDASKIVVDESANVDILGNPDGLERVLQNLLENATRYGKPNGEVHVTAERHADHVAITVADDGPGIAAEHLPRLFERFYRVDASRSREFGGAGLGLAIVKHDVELMNGTVIAESEVGKGARFIVDLGAASST